MPHQSTLIHQSSQFFSTQTAEYSYRAAVRELVPQLCYLDNLRVEECHSSSIMGEDWIILQNVIKDSKTSRTAAEEGLCFKCGLGSLMHTWWSLDAHFFSAEETTKMTCPGSRALSAGHLFSPSFVLNHHSTDSRPTTGSIRRSTTRPGPLPPPGQRPGSAGLRLKTLAAETSILTHG